MRALTQSLTCLMAMACLSLPSWADIKPTDFDHREIEVQASGSTATEAMQHCEEAAIEAIVKTLVQTDAERQKYAAIRSELLDQRQKFVKRLKILGKGTDASGGRFYKVIFEVQAKEIQDFLTLNKVIRSTQELSQELNHPMIAAYYLDPRDDSSYALWAVERINYFLLEQKFRIVSPEVWRELALDEALLTGSKGNPQRLGQMMALKARADIFIEVDIKPQIVGKSGDYTYVQSPVRVRAFEASSGEPFITKIYQRQNAQGEAEALAIKGNLDVTAKAVIEESVAGAMPMVLTDLTAHWKQNLAMGKQYRLIFKNMPKSKQAALETALKTKVKNLTSTKQGEYLVRYAGDLGDLADEIEESMGKSWGLSLDSFDLGNAYFSFP